MRGKNKAVAVFIISIILGMSVVTTAGTIDAGQGMDASRQRTKEATGWETKENEARVSSPAINFPLVGEVFRPGDIVEVNGTVAMLQFQNFTLEWGVGLTPVEWSMDGIILIDNGTSEITNGTLGFWDTPPMEEASYYTLRLTVYFSGLGQVSVEVSIYFDPSLHPSFPFGWPQEIQGSQVAIWSPIALDDINEDGLPEIGFGTITVTAAGDNNYDYIIDHQGNCLPGWPKKMYYIQGASLTFADIDSATSQDEVIGGLWGQRIYAWHTDGSTVDGWPKSISDSRSSATISDLDGDGDYEIILPSTSGGGKIYVWHHDGTLAAGWPVLIGSPVRNPASTADIDKDGFGEILFGDDNGQVHALHYNGSAVEGWPQQGHDLIKSSPVLADLEGDGDLEVIVASGFSESRIISIWHHDGTLMEGWPQENGLCFVQPSVGDLDGDGDLEICAGGGMTGSPNGRFYVWHHDGTLFDGWPLIFMWDGSQYLDFMYAQPDIGDIDGDGDVEIVVGSYHKKMYAWHHDGSNVTGWPKVTGGEIDSTAALGDVDGDGLVEVTVAGDDGKVYMWDLGGAYNASTMQWPMFQYDAHHTGCYGNTTAENLPPSPPSIDGRLKGKAGHEYVYNMSSVDPEGDDVYYYIDWGDGMVESWAGPYLSGDIISFSHTWEEKDSYAIKAKAKDTWGAESDWATLEVTMPATYHFTLMDYIMKLVERFPHAFPLLRWASHLFT